MEMCARGETWGGNKNDSLFEGRALARLDLPSVPINLPLSPPPGPPCTCTGAFKLCSGLSPALCSDHLDAIQSSALWQCLACSGAAADPVVLWKSLFSASWELLPSCPGLYFLSRAGSFLASCSASWFKLNSASSCKSHCHVANIESN